MSPVNMLPKCADGYCGWRGCWDGATSATFRMRLASGVADVTFCAFHKRCAIPGNGGIMPTSRAGVWVTEASTAA
jgi:hypothetical protein